MATSKTTKPKSGRKNKAETVPEAAQAIANAETPVQQPLKAAKIRRKLNPNMYVEVRNGFHGHLIYTDSGTGETYEWDQFGDTIDLTIATLQKVRAGQRRFFEDNWFLIDDPEVIEFLNIGQYYKNALSFDEFDTIFELGADEITERIKTLSAGQKRGVAFAAVQKIEDGTLNNLNTIRALEAALDVDLIER